MTSTEVENHAVAALVDFRRAYENALLAFHTGEGFYLGRAEEFANQGLRSLKEEREFSTPNHRLQWQLEKSLAMEAAE